ncbi:hypothetical protein YZ70_00025 [Campylobacter concisus]|uniref:hypothetical protein n=1 Tax=Campylobacter concisus TaxID=199 RepID=UPI00187E271B|nr:hypothetical protein [Campylobacter concisus]MBE8583923.1 hypothetical protein [Campylobacter concisus]
MLELSPSCEQPPIARIASDMLRSLSPARIPSSWYPLKAVAHPPKVTCPTTRTKFGFLSK